METEESKTLTRLAVKNYMASAKACIECWMESEEMTALKCNCKVCNSCFTKQLADGQESLKCPFCDPTTMPVGEQNRLPEMVLQAVTCAVCFFKKKYQLKLKKCGHRFCITCTYKIKKQDESVKCPICRSVSKGEEIVADVQTTDLFLYFQPQLEAVREDGEEMETYELPLEYQYPDGVDFLEEPSESDMEEMDSTYEDEEMDESVQFMNIFEQSMDFVNQTLELPDTSADIFDEASNLPSQSNDSLQTTNNWEDARNLLEDIENYFTVHGM